MAIAFVSEIVIYVISCFVVGFMRGFVPSFIEIFACVFLNEMIKLFFKWYYGNGAQTQIMLIPEQCYNMTEEEIEKNGIPIVYSLMILKICEGLDIKVQLSPVEIRDTWSKKIKKTNKCIPIVRSEMIFKICNALNLPAKLELNEGWNIEDGVQTKKSSRSKAPLVVNAATVYKICLALGLPVQLNEEALNATA
ncbi:hypothetical protein NPIL_628331 [Nephila pilipes]|uniref:Uncharacterized protein n=1 Tax=Nephila pilipes TaxID=299642 RepID=A0A8X6UHX5_NEPPI|nr:hypothetical protein NPIL_628331 [Nephila pilipes]